MRNEKTSEKAHTLPTQSPSKDLSNDIWIIDIHPQDRLISAPLSCRFISPTTFVSIVRDEETSTNAHNTSLKSPRGGALIV